MTKKKAESSDIKTDVKTEELIKQILQDLLTQLKIEATIEVFNPETDHYKIEAQTQETGLLIGYHGETINSLQLLLGVILYKRTGQWLHVVLDVGGYRKMREENIKEMVQRIVSEVETAGQPVVLPYLTPLERRIVHMMLAESVSVTSQSSGEGKDRRITIGPRQSAS